MYPLPGNNKLWILKPVGITKPCRQHPNLVGHGTNPKYDLIGCSLHGHEFTIAMCFSNSAGAVMAKKKLLELSRSLHSKADNILELANEEESEGETSSPSPPPSPKVSCPRARYLCRSKHSHFTKRETYSWYVLTMNNVIFIEWPTELLKKAEKLSKALKNPPSASATEQCSSGRGSKDRGRGNKRGKDENITVWACS